MKKPFQPIETMVENQNKLVDTFTTNAMKAMEIFKMEDNWSKKSKELFETFLKEQKQLAEKAIQPASYEKGIEGVTEQFVKAMEMNWNFANKSMDMYREAISSMTDGKQENPITRMFELYNDNMHAVMDVTKKNMEAFRNTSWN